MDKQTAELGARILQNLPEMDSVTMQKWIENPQDLRRRLAEALLPVEKLKIWKTIELGTGLKTVDDFCQAIGVAGGTASDLAIDIMGKPDFLKSISSDALDLDLCVATVEELVGEKGSGGTFFQVYKGITLMGGKILPAEVGPQLIAQQYLGQPNGILLVAMEPIRDSSGVLRIFTVSYSYGDSDSELCTFSGPDVLIWPHYHRVVFALPRDK